MKKANKYSSNKIVESIGCIIVGIGILILAAFLVLSIKVDGISTNSVIALPFALLLGLFASIGGIINLVKSIYRTGEIDKVMQSSNWIMAHIDGEVQNNYEGRVIACSAEITGTRQEFHSEPIKFDLMYAAKELGIEEIKVYISQDDPTKYIVDTSEIESRIVDLT